MQKDIIKPSEFQGWEPFTNDMIKYFIFCLFILQQSVCLGQKKVFGNYARFSADNAISMQLNKNFTFKYKLGGERAKFSYSGTYIVHNDLIHLIVKPKLISHKISIVYKNSNSDNRSIQMIDNQNLAYVGASVLINAQTHLTTDTNGTIVLPKGLIVKTINMKYVDVKDTTIVLNDPGKGNIEISLPVQSFRDIQSDLVIKDWLLKKYRLYAVRNHKANLTFFLKRLR